MFVLIAILPNISGGERVENGYFGINNIKLYLTPQIITNLRETAYYDTISTSVTPNAVTPNAVTPNTVTPNTVTPNDSQNQPIKDSPPDNQIQPSKKELTGSQKQTVEPKLAKGSESSVIIKTGFENPFIFLRNTLWSSISALLGPFPWQLKKPQQFLILPEVIAWYFFLFFIIKGIVTSIKTQYKVIVPLVVFSVIVFGVLGVFINNYGIITRIRIPAVLSLLCLFPLGYKGLKNIKIPFLNI